MKHAMSCGCALERRPRLGQGTGLGGFHVSKVILEREGDGRHVDARPVEGREPVGLGRVGVGQRHRVTGPAVERARQVQHLGAEIPGTARCLVAAALPVEGRLERVLDRQGAPLHEEQVRQRRITEHPGEGFDELREVGRVHVRVGRLADRHLGEQRHEPGIINDARRVGTERRRRKMRVKVEELPPIAGIDQPAAVTTLHVENQPIPVDQQMPGEPLVHLGCRHMHAATLAHAPPQQNADSLPPSQQRARTCGCGAGRRRSLSSPMSATMACRTTGGARSVLRISELFVSTSTSLPALVLENEDREDRQHQAEHAQREPSRGERGTALARPPDLAVRLDAKDDRRDLRDPRDQPAHQGGNGQRVGPLPNRGMVSRQGTGRLRLERAKRPGRQVG